MSDTTMKKQPHELPGWKKLSQHKEAIQKTELRKMFANDPKRFESFTRNLDGILVCLLYTSPSPRDGLLSRMPSSA